MKTYLNAAIAALTLIPGLAAAQERTPPDALKFNETVIVQNSGAEDAIALITQRRQDSATDLRALIISGQGASAQIEQSGGGGLGLVYVQQNGRHFAHVQQRATGTGGWQDPIGIGGERFSFTSVSDPVDYYAGLGGNSVSVVQGDKVGVSGGAQASVAQSGQGLLAFLHQGAPGATDLSGTVANLSQNGSDLVASVWQGNHNEDLMLVQSGTGNTAVISQHYSANLLDATQSGVDNGMSVDQGGDTIGRISQTGNRGQLLLLQNSTGGGTQEADITQSIGTLQFVDVYQQARTATATVEQQAGGGAGLYGLRPASVTVRQIGGDNLQATVFQGPDASGAFAAIEQHAGATGALATITQMTPGARASIYQNTPGALAAIEQLN